MPDLPVGVLGADTGPKLRILQCFTCQTLEELPDYPRDGIPEDDAFLHYLDEKHGGMTQQPHHRALLDVSERHWKNDRTRAQMVEQMWSKESGFKPEWYARRDTLTEDALKCFAKHNRQVPCIDWMDSSKRIGNPEAKDRSLLAKALKRTVQDIGPGPQIFLCNFCPCCSHVNNKKWESANPK